jgi:hypothetical protein
MSLARMAYYCAVIGGWSAFFAWMICEVAFLSRGGSSIWQVIFAAGIVGGAIGAGLNAVAGMSNGGLFQTVKRLGPGLIGGGIGGAVGGLLGNLLFANLGMPRVIGWVIMGLGIGVVEGLYEKSPSKIRNGLIGGGLGGLAGGVLFDLLPSLIHTGSGMSSRATGFVILGLCIGALIGLVQVALRDAWLTVVDGYRVGRQLILSSPVTILGRGDHLPLPFIGGPNTDLEIQHLSIEHRPTGGYFLRDLTTRLGSFVNGVPVQGEVELHDGDTIKLAGNFVRFNLRHRTAGAKQDAGQQAVQPVKTTVPLPPPAALKQLPRPATASKPASAPTATGLLKPITSPAPIKTAGEAVPQGSVPLPQLAPLKAPLPPPKAAAPQPVAPPIAKPMGAKLTPLPPLPPLPPSKKPD